MPHSCRLVAVMGMDVTDLVVDGRTLGRYRFLNLFDLARPTTSDLAGHPAGDGNP